MVATLEFANIAVHAFALKAEAVHAAADRRRGVLVRRLLIGCPLAKPPTPVPHVTLD